VNRSIWLLCISLSLAGCQQGSDEPKVAGRWYTQSQLDLGKKVYTENCIACHNENAQGTFSWRTRDSSGNYPPPPPLNGTAHAWHHPLGMLKKTIEEGGVPQGGKMPSFGDKLKKEEKFAVIAYFQSFWSGEIYAEWLKRGGLN